MAKFVIIKDLKGHFLRVNPDHIVWYLAHPQIIGQSEIAMANGMSLQAMATIKELDELLIEKVH